MAAILKFGSIFKKSLAHPHAARNVMFFLSFYAPPQKKKIKVDLWRPF